MFIRQLTVFVENRSGRLGEITCCLRDNNVNIKALSLADTENFGILRLIVNDPEHGEKALKEAGFAVKLNRVICIAVDDKPGGLCEALDLFLQHEIALEYMYAFIGRSENSAQVILRPDDRERALQLLLDNGFQVIGAKEAYGA